MTVADRPKRPTARVAATVGLAAVAVLCGCEATPTPAEALKATADVTSADRRRAGIAVLAVEYPDLHRPPYTTRFADAAKSDPAPTVRAMAVRALNLCRERSATPVFIAALDDDNDQVRLEGVKALANVPDPAAIATLIQRMQGQRTVVREGRAVTTPETKDVRIAAADALGRYRQPDVARSLVATLGDADFGVVWQARLTLLNMTGRDLHYDQKAWTAFLEGPEKPAG